MSWWDVSLDVNPHQPSSQQALSRALCHRCRGHTEQLQPLGPCLCSARHGVRGCISVLRAHPACRRSAKPQNQRSQHHQGRRCLRCQRCLRCLRCQRRQERRVPPSPSQMGEYRQAAKRQHIKGRAYSSHSPRNTETMHANQPVLVLAHTVCLIKYKKMTLQAMDFYRSRNNPTPSAPLCGHNKRCLCWIVCRP